MRILVTGAGGFVGKNLLQNLRAIAEGKNRTRPGLLIEEIMEYHHSDGPARLEGYCARADFVFHLAGVNRPEDPAEFLAGNRDATAALLEALDRQKNPCPVLLASSIQASLTGPYSQSEYGRSKRAAEALVFAHASRTGGRPLVYRFPNLFGKWGRPDYNSVVATFCYNIARGLPIQIRDPETELELVYIDDLVEEMLDALEGREHRCECRGVENLPDPAGAYCCVPVSHRVTLGRIAELLSRFEVLPQTIWMPEMGPDSFEKKLCATYLSYLPPEKACTPLRMNCDERGSFTELLRTPRSGQFSVNVSRPGVTKGQHWHNTKWEFFVVVSGHGRVRQRRLDSGEVTEYDLSGEKLEAVRLLPGYTHSLVNLSDTEDLITVMWANEPFDPSRPDTCFEPV